MKHLLTIIDAISEYTGRLVAFLCIPILVIIVMEVVARYLFAAPFIWSHEVTTFLCTFLYLIGGAYVLRNGGHISVDLIHKNLSPRGKAIMDLVASFFFFIYCGVLLWAGFSFASTSIQILERSGSAWNPPIYPVKAAIPAAAFLILLAGLAKFIRDFKIAVTGREES